MNPDTIIASALAEDLGDGDHTTLATIAPGATGRARLLVKDHGILCGVDLAMRIFKHTDPALAMNILMADGHPVQPGDIAFTVSGKAASILTAERLVLNFMQRLSGIATATNLVVRQLEGLKTRVLDTRKTTPLLRELEKYAVRTGGGSNHRMGLYDMIMIKDNHVDFAGGIEPAIRAVNDYLLRTGRDLKIEIEVRNFRELNQVLVTGMIHRVMLDNFTLPDLELAVEKIAGRFETEASGGITLANARSYAETGVDFISVGALTHQVKSLDMSLKAGFD